MILILASSMVSLMRFMLPSPIFIFLLIFFILQLLG